MTVAEIAVYTQLHPQTIRKALRSGDLVGSQRTPLGTWRARQPDVDRFMAGEQPRRIRVA